jgi:Domain of unknown function (DUF6456)
MHVAMPTRRRTRALKRIAARTESNAKARDAALTLEEEEPQRPRFVRHCTHLERLCNRGVITVAQREAGERLRHDWYVANEERPYLVARYAPRMSGKRYGAPPRLEDAEHQVAARERYAAALKAVDPTLAALLVHVCVTDQSPSSGRPRPADGGPCLRFALDTLAAHYRAGMAQAA